MKKETTIEGLFVERFLETERKAEGLKSENRALRKKLREEKERADRAEAIIGALQPIVRRGDGTGSAFVKIKNDYIFPNGERGDALYKGILPYATEEGNGNGAEG